MTECFSIPDCSLFHQVLGPISGSSLTLIHVNIRSLRKHWDEFQISVNNLNPPIDIFVLTEIGISSSHCNQFILNGYKDIFYTRHNSRGGGIAIYIRDKWLT